MIPLILKAKSDALEPFVARISKEVCLAEHDMALIQSFQNNFIFSGINGLLEINAPIKESILGDVVCVDPHRGIVERLIRANSKHNTLLITEQCDQLCVMCSQPPKKKHIDRFLEYKKACILAPLNSTIGISGGEPTLYKNELFDLIENTYSNRPDISFHILTNAQHFEESDELILRKPAFKNVTWGIPIYSSEPDLHDEIVSKPGAFSRLMDSFIILLKSGAGVEVRTVIMNNNIECLANLALFLTTNFGFVNQWSIMQLENIGFAKNRFDQIYFDHSKAFDNVGKALDISELYGIKTVLFNFAKCAVPINYRRYCVSSISDWKQKFVDSCDICAEKTTCAGFFEWHPQGQIGVAPL